MVYFLSCGGGVVEILKASLGKALTATTLFLEAGDGERGACWYSSARGEGLE